MDNTATQVAVPNTAPVKAAFICLCLAWAMALLPIPFISMGGMVTFNIIAFILAIICMSKNAVKNGALVLAGTLIGTPIMYFIGMAIFAGEVAGAVNEAAKELHQAQVQQAKAADPSGKWSGKFIYPAGIETKFTLSLSLSKDKLAGKLTEIDPKTSQPVDSVISGSLINDQQFSFTQDFGGQYPVAKCNANFSTDRTSMTGKCVAGSQSADFTARLL